jgi:uracil-DNA glycosylase family 4
MDANQKAAALQALFDKYNTCTRCPLGNSRLKFVFGVGNPDAEVLFIGEGPGYEEDHRGEPFIGRAGQLLDKMMDAIGMSRKTVYIANIVKCHAMINPQTPHEHGNDRAPTPLEAETCAPILQQQIAVIQPRIIVTLGSPSTRTVLGTLEGISKVRGRFFPMPMTFFRVQINESDLFDEKKNDDFMGFTPDQLEPLKTIQVLPIYHPAALLRNPNLKKDTWEDMKLLRNTLQTPA